MATFTTGDNNFAPAKWIVNKTAGLGTHTTIASALTSASSGDTIFIMPNTYTENLTLQAGVNLTAYQCDGVTPNVIIVGKCTATFSGTCTITGIQLKTNSDYLLVVSGSNATIVNLFYCNLNAINNTGISFTSSNSGSEINIEYCIGNLGTTGIAIFSMTSTGGLYFSYSNFTNSGGSTTVSSLSAGSLFLGWSGFTHNISTTSSGVIQASYTTNNTANTTCYTTAGTGAATFTYCEMASGSASAISAGSGTTVQLYGCRIDCSNTNAITGSGTVVADAIIFTGSSHLSNVTTQTGGAISGLTQGTAPSAGYIGEQIRSAIAEGSAISLTTEIPKNITSISLTAGIWDVTGIIDSPAQACTGTAYAVSVSTTSATLGTGGDNTFDGQPPTAILATSVSCPAYRITLSATTTVYLVAQCNFSSGTCTVYGRISATRVG